MARSTPGCDARAWKSALAVPEAGAEAAAMVTLVEAFALPAVLVHVSVKVVADDNGPTDCVPEVALLPLQPPLAVHAVALADAHVSVTLLFAATDAALEVIDAVG